MTKIKTIKLSDGWPAEDAFNMTKDQRASKRFRVEQLTDSIDFTTGEYLDRPAVESLVHSRDWKVTIVPPKG
jgi:hypothetical protein